MKTFGLGKAKICIAKPDLDHKPRDAFHGPMIRGCMTYENSEQISERGPEMGFHLPSVHNVKRRPEKQTAAMVMKNTNSAIMPRKALWQVIIKNLFWSEIFLTNLQNDNVILDSEKC